MTMNAHSLQSKFNEMVSRISDFDSKITFILITETWLNEENDAGFEIPGYKSINVYRTPSANGSSYGGLKLYFLEQFSPTIIEQNNTGPCEFLLTKFYIPSFGDLIVCCIYRPPDRNLNEFNIFLENIFNVYCSKKFILFGDQCEKYGLFRR